MPFSSKKINEGFVEFRLDRTEAEPAPQGVIYDGERSVSRVHAAYQINILGYKETFVILVAVGQLYGVLLLAFVGLYQHHQLTQNLADVSSVYLVDDEDKLLVRRTSCLAAEVKENAIPPFKAALLRRTDALHKILITVRLMKLHHLDVLILHKANQLIGYLSG